jgi:hypothetical protein
MRPNDTADALDREDFDGDEFGLEAPGADPIDQAVAAEADPIVDDDLLEAELGELDAPLAADEIEDLDAELLDAPDDEDEDDQEVCLLQELGIDLDAPDPDPDRDRDIDLGFTLHDDPIDDEVAA